MQQSYKSRPKYSGSRSARRPQHFKQHAKRGVKRPLPADKFIHRAIPLASEAAFVPENTFADFALNQRIKDTMAHLKLTTPTPIQDLAIPPSLDGRDVIGLANTGTGKTAAFLLPTIDKMARQRQAVSSLVLTPTRELAQQIDAEFRRFAAGQKLYSTLVVGGTNINRQIQQIKRGPHIIVGTPGRIKDLIDRKVLRLGNVNSFILDEADRMCDMGFVGDIRYIEQELSPQRQTLCFSATMTDNVQAIVEDFMTDPLTVSVARNVTSQHIEQDVIYARDKAHRFDLLTDLLDNNAVEKIIIFGDTKYGVQRLADNLTKQGYPAVAIHGNKSQSQRERALKSFKQNSVNIMVATDVAARGLDIPNVTHVINFDTPTVYADYIHRIGRTGRAGQTGKALTFVEG